jgi:hypothetical protein
MLAGDLVAAERELRLSYAMYQHMSEKDNLSTVAADLAGVLAWKGHTSESLRLTEESRVLAAREDVWSHTLWRSVQATVLAQQGQTAEAERLARAAGELAAQTDFLDLHTGVLLTLAEVLRSAGNAPRFGRCSTTQRCSTTRKATLCHWHVLSLCSTINGELHTWSENGTCCLRLACPERRRATATARPSHCATGSRRLLRPGHSFRRAGPRSSRRSSTCLSGRFPYGEASWHLTENVNLMVNQLTVDECNAAAEELAHYLDAGLPEPGSSWLPSYTTSTMRARNDGVP